MSENQTDDEPVAYAFQVKPLEVGHWDSVVDFNHPDETYRSYDGFEVRNIRPLYERE